MVPKFLMLQSPFDGTSFQNHLPFPLLQGALLGRHLELRQHLRDGFGGVLLMRQPGRKGTFELMAGYS